MNNYSAKQTSQKLSMGVIFELSVMIPITFSNQIWENVTTRSIVNSERGFSIRKL